MSLPCLEEKAAELLERRALLEAHLNLHRSNLSAFSFVNIFSWQEFFDFEFRLINGQLCIFARNEVGRFLYLPPLGREAGAGTLESCFALMDEVNTSRGISRVENVGADFLDLFPEENYVRVPKGHEYCYYKEDIARLKGGAFKSKRWSYNHCARHYDCRYLPYDESMDAECLGLYERWAKQRRAGHDGEVYTQMLKENQRVHALVLRYAKPLGLAGRVVIIDGEIKGYTFGFELNPLMFCVLFEIADLNIKGLPVYIFREFCGDPALASYRFVNVMDDFELENMRRVKMSFRPVALFPSYMVKRKESFEPERNRNERF